MSNRVIPLDEAERYVPPYDKNNIISVFMSLTDSYNCVVMRNKWGVNISVRVLRQVPVSLSCSQLLLRVGFNSYCIGLSLIYRCMRYLLCYRNYSGLINEKGRSAKEENEYSWCVKSKWLCRF